MACNTSKLSLSLVLCLALFVNLSQCSDNAKLSVPARNASSPQHIPLNGFCFGNAPNCGDHAFCSTQSQCKCDLGFVPSLDGVNCQVYSCNEDVQCNGTFGTGTKCQFNECICDASFQLDPTTQTCFTTKQPLNSVCTYGYQCGVNTICGNYRCECEYGFPPSKFNRVNCDYFSCLKSAQCQQQFGNHSECLHNTCACNVTSGWNLDVNTQTCMPNHRLINQTCNSVNDCGANTVCGDEKCRCKMSFTADTSGLINCQSYTCSRDTDCAARFDPHATCFLGTCMCSSDLGYKLSVNNQTCIAKSQSIGGMCATSFDCGLNANCINNRCKCQFGDAPSTMNHMDCGLKICTADSDCTQLDPNTECSLSMCVCKHGFRLDQALQVCADIPAFDNPLLMVAGLVGAGLVLAISMAVLVLAIKSYRRTRYVQKC